MFFTRFLIIKFNLISKSFLSFGHEIFWKLRLTCRLMLFSILSPIFFGISNTKKNSYNVALKISNSTTLSYYLITQIFRI